MRVAADVAQRGDVLVVEDRAEAVGIVARHRPSADLDAQGGSSAATRASKLRDEEAGLVPPLHRRSSSPASSDDQDGARLRQHGADLPDAGRDLVRTEHRERVAVLGRDDRRDGAFAAGADELRCPAGAFGPGAGLPARARRALSSLPRRHSPSGAPA